MFAGLRVLAVVVLAWVAQVAVSRAQVSASGQASASAAVNGVAASLSYVREAGAEGCPDEAALKDAVHLQLGYPVFERTPATRAVSVSVNRVRGRFVARLALQSDTGASLGSREIDSRSATCDELSAALSLAISLALDPTPMMRAPNDPPVTDAPAPTSACPEPATCPVCPQPTPTPAPVATPSASNVAWTAGVGLALGVGALPSVAPAFAVELGLKLERFSLLLEGVAYPESTSTQQGIDLEAQAQVARLSACGWLSPASGVDLAACGLGGLGALRAASPAALDRSVTLIGTAGVRTALHLRVSGPVWLQVRGDIHANLLSTTVSIDDVRLWTTPSVFLELAVLGVVRFS